MKVRRFYRPGATCTSPAETLGEAARKMRRSGLSCLAVIDEGQVAGIVTERDVVEAVANGAHPAQARVLDYMNDGSVTVSLDDDSATATLKMLVIGCRHLPVVEGKQLVGTVSARDLHLLLAGDGARPAAVGAVPGAPDVWPEEASPDADSER